ncbi:MAG: hypothetical protein LQ342_008195 [Letrouitia transgressa]|nr:MAG: hypothetical protein LQ342_008195 [Letrouitia transgressa]
MASAKTAASPAAPHLLNPNSTHTALNKTPPQEKSKPNDIVAEFNYYKDPGDGSPPAPAIIGKPETYDRPEEHVRMVVHDVRGDEDKLSLDTTGFQIYRHVSAEKDFRDEDQVKRVYYPEIEAMMKEITGASHIHIFDHTIRRQPLPQPTSAAGSDLNQPKPNTALSDPVRRVHVDQSYAAAPDRVHRHLPADLAPHLLSGRFEIVNAWRPIRTIRKDPLGIVDASSCPDSDLLPDKLIFPDRVGETFTVKPSPEHRWCYLHEQTPEEVLVFRCFDSDEGRGRARRAPHSSFIDERYVNEEARESIEVRTLVFHVDD